MQIMQTAEVFKKVKMRESAIPIAARGRPALRPIIMEEAEGERRRQPLLRPRTSAAACHPSLRLRRRRRVYSADDVAAIDAAARTTSVVLFGGSRSHSQSESFAIDSRYISTNNRPDR